MMKMARVSIWSLILVASVVVCDEVKNTKPANESSDKQSSADLMKSLPADLSRVVESEKKTSSSQQDIVGASSDLLSALIDGPESGEYYELAAPQISGKQARVMQTQPLEGQLRHIHQLNQALEASQSMSRKLNEEPSNLFNGKAGSRSNYSPTRGGADDRFFQDEPASSSESSKLARRRNSAAHRQPSAANGVASQRQWRGESKGSDVEQLDSEDYSDSGAASELARAADDGSADVFDEEEEPLTGKANQRRPLRAAQARATKESVDASASELADQDDDDDDDSAVDDGSESANSQQLQPALHAGLPLRPLKGIEDSAGLLLGDGSELQPSSLKGNKRKPEVELFLQADASKSGSPMKATASDLQMAAGYHHKHHHDHFYQYAEVPKKKAWKMGFKRGNHKHMISRHEKGYKNKFHSSFNWNAKEKCKKKGKCHSKGKMTWHYEHHDKKKKHHY